MKIKQAIAEFFWIQKGKIEELECPGCGKPIAKKRIYGSEKEYILNNKTLWQKLGLPQEHKCQVKE